MSYIQDFMTDMLLKRRVTIGEWEKGGFVCKYTLYNASDNIHSKAFGIETLYAKKEKVTADI